MSKEHETASSVEMASTRTGLHLKSYGGYHTMEKGGKGRLESNLSDTYKSFLVF